MVVQSQSCPGPQFAAQRSVAYLLSVLSFVTVANGVHAKQGSEAKSLLSAYQSLVWLKVHGETLCTRYLCQVHRSLLGEPWA